MEIRFGFQSALRERRVEDVLAYEYHRARGTPYVQHTVFLADLALLHGPYRSQQHGLFSGAEEERGEAQVRLRYPRIDHPRLEEQVLLVKGMPTGTELSQSALLRVTQAQDALLFRFGSRSALHGRAVRGGMRMYEFWPSVHAEPTYLSPDVHVFAYAGSFPDAAEEPDLYRDAQPQLPAGGEMQMLAYRSDLRGAIAEQVLLVVESMLEERASKTALVRASVSRGRSSGGRASFA